MATPADIRLLELLEKWLTSLELHAQYAALDDLGYAKVQSWPDHDRPSRWIIELAKEKTLALRGQVQERIASGDGKFSDSLELMTFLTNLVGSEHIERYIPLAEPAAATGAWAATGTQKMPLANGNAAPPPPGAARTERRPATGEVKAAAVQTPRSGAAYDRRDPAAAYDRRVPPGAAYVPSVPPAAANYRRGPAAAHDRSVPPAAAHDRSMPPAAAHAQVIEDAARLVQAGRKWYEVAEIIAAMADRPPLTDVRRILKDSKDAIDLKAGRG